eukprot:2298615-Prymnesium_polylepis.1
MAVLGNATMHTSASVDVLMSTSASFYPLPNLLPGLVAPGMSGGACLDMSCAALLTGVRVAPDGSFDAHVTSLPANEGAAPVRKPSAI